MNKLPNSDTYFRPFFPMMLSLSPTTISTRSSMAFLALSRSSGTKGSFAVRTDRRNLEATKMSSSATTSAVAVG